jgi:serine/threonine protein kinase
MFKLPNYSKYPVFQDKNVREFIKMCLIKDPEKRPSAAYLLTADWFKEY